MSEAVVTTQDYVRAAIAGDALKAQEIFQQLMSPKVVDAVDQKKTEIAQNYFGQQPEVIVDNPDVPEIEDSAAVQNANSNRDNDEQQNTADTEEESNENA
jgi:glycerol-3-phosphate dehydrogenase